jgi:uncharacterized protein (TIGR02678 family)
LVQEARLEGVAMIDPEEWMTDAKMPEEGTNGHATLLVAEYLANRIRQGITHPLSVAALEIHTESLVQEHRHHWRKDVREPGAAGVLLEEALYRLEMLRLIAPDRKAQTVTPLPAIGRFAIGPVRDEAIPPNE